MCSGFNGGQQLARDKRTGHRGCASAGILRQRGMEPWKIVIAILFTLLLSVSTLFLLLFVAPKLRYRAFPGPPSESWLFGNFYIFAKRRGFAHVVLTELAQKYGRTYQFFAFHRRVVVCVDPLDVRHICVTRNYPKSEVFADPMRRFTPDGLLVAGSEKHRAQRMAICKLFNVKFLDDFYRHMKLELAVLVKKLDAEAESGGQVDIDAWLVSALLDVIARATLSVSLDSQSSRAGLSKAMGWSLLEIHRHMALYPFGPWYPGSMKRLNSSMALIHSFVRSVISARKQETREAKAARPRDLLDVFMTVKGATDEYLCGEVTTFLIAGHDTTAHTLSWLLYEVSKRPDIEEKVIAEVKSVFGDLCLQEFVMPDSEKLRQLQYCEMVIDEVLRLHPIAATGSMRVTTKDDTLPGTGFHVKKGTSVLMPPYPMHHDPEFWEKPEDFCPERFSPDGVRARRDKGICYIPFSIGPRNCVGQFVAKFEALIVVAILYSRYEIRLACEPNATREFHAVTLKPRTYMDERKAGLPVTVRRRYTGQ